VFWWGAYQYLQATGCSHSAHEAFSELGVAANKVPGSDWRDTHPYLQDLKLPGGTILRDYQKQAVAALMSGDLLLGDDMGLGKAQPLHSKVLCPNGWRQIGDLQVGDEVMCPISGQPVKVSGIFPQGIKEVWELHTEDEEVVECCADHLWMLGPYGNVYTTEELSRKPKEFLEQTHLYHINATMDLHQNLSRNLHPYLLGAYLGDGSSCDTLTTSDSEMVEVFSELLVDGSIKKASSKYDWSVTCPKFKLALSANGLKGKRAWEKFVPNKYKFGCAQTRLAVLQGLLDTDGTQASATSIKYTTTSPRLCEDVKFIVRSLGGYCWSKFEPNKHRGSYRVYIWMGPEYLPFRLKRRLEKYNRPSRYEFLEKLKKVRRIEMIVKTDRKASMRCISVDSPYRLYITDGEVVTHNTLSVLTARQLMVQNYGMAERTLVCVPQSEVADEWARMAKEHWQIPIHIIDSPKALTKKFAELLGIWVITYSKVWRENYRDGIVEFLRGCKHPLIVCDEAHSLAGYNSKQSLWMQRLSTQASTFWALSGTEVANMPDSYWAMYALVTRQADKEEVGLDAWVSYLTDGLTEADGITPRWSEEKCKSIAHIRNLFALRRLKTEVAKDLPPLTGPIIHLVPMTPAHRRCYEELWNKSRFEFESQLNELDDYQIDSFAARFIRLYQVTTYPYLLPELHSSKADLRPLYKLERLVSLLSDAGGQKCVVWCSFPGAIEWLATEVRHALPRKSVVTAHGQVDKDERKVIKEDFQAGKYDILIANTAIWSQGVTLTAASVFIYWDIHPSRIRWAQSLDRGYRIGQTNPVTIICLLHSDSCEIMTLNHIRKKEYFSGLLTTGEGKVETLKTHSKFTPMIFVNNRNST
jgi:hypothetical protein